LNLRSQQKDKNERLSSKTIELPGDEGNNIKPESNSNNNKASLDKQVKQSGKKISKFSIVNLLFNR